MAKDTEQLLLRPSVALVEQLDEAVEKFGKRSRNEIAVEILETYFPFWEQAEQAKLDLIEEQRLGVGVYARGKGSQKEIEMVKKDAQSHNSKKR
jgi:metal-responsive CopG/Arc/MetJ family transcriptional regulator